MTDGSQPSMRNFVAEMIERRAQALAVSEPELVRLLGGVAEAADLVEAPDTPEG